MKKLFCYLLLMGLLLTPASRAHSFSVKTQGKFALAAVLSGVAILTKFLVARDQRTVGDLHTKLGPPDRAIEWERGFNRWRVEWYGHQKYIFRNNILQKTEVDEEVKGNGAIEANGKTGR